MQSRVIIFFVFIYLILVLVLVLVAVVLLPACASYLVLDPPRNHG